MASGSNGTTSCPVCSAEVFVPASEEPETAPSDGGTSARGERARSTSVVATDDQPGPSKDRSWERMIDEMMPIPWDERDRTWLARTIDTVSLLALQPERFFRSMATDRDAGATRLAAGAIGAASIGLAWSLTGFVVGAGSNVSPVLIGLEIALLSGLVLAILGGFRAAVTGLVLRLSRRRLRGVRRVAAFSTAPMVLGIVPFVGLLVGLALGARAYATGLRVRFGFSSSSAWALALVPGPLLFVVGVAGLFALVGAG